MIAYYNEIDPNAAQWLRNLIDAGHIAPGFVDERSIEDVRPDELIGYTQCHFFAGIGVWSYALRQAGWPDDKPVWTGSCPCQPFSTAGKGNGFDDERHLWPHFHWLIEQCRPPVIFGEQVASKDGLGWIDLVQADLEGAGYTSGAVDTCSAGFGAPHIRQRLFWVAHTCEFGQSRPGKMGRSRNTAQETDREIHRVIDAGRSSGLAHSEHPGHGGPQGNPTESGGDQQNFGISDRGHPAPEGQSPAGPVNGFWRDADWLFCRDGKWRPVRSGTFPLVNGSAGRVGRLRAYGNAINAEAAKEFIAAFFETSEREK